MHPVAVASPTDRVSPARVVAIIPARYESSRFPGKPLADIAGRSMIEHVYRRAEACRLVGRVIVATDDRRILDAVEAFGGRAMLTRATHQSGTDRIAEVSASLDCDIVVNVQGDEPLVEPAMIEEAVAPLAADPGLPMATLRRRIDDDAEFRDPNVVKVVVDRESFALYFSRAPIPATRNLAPGDRGLLPVYRHIGLYAYRRSFLLEFARLDPTPLEQAEALEQLRALEHGYRIKAVETRHASIGVDTPDDLERVRRLVMASARA